MIKSLKYLTIPNNKPWLIVGKGPSFSQIWDIDTKDYYILGLNEVATKIPVNIMHFIDLEVLSYRKMFQFDYCVMPFHPHKKNKPGDTVTTYEAFIPFLQQVDKDGRLFVYNLSTYKGRVLHHNTPYITAKYFSVEAAFRILCNAGVRQIYSLGIDGGNRYAEEFSDLKPLTNGRDSFDPQFAELNKIVHSHKLSWVQL